MLKHVLRNAMIPIMTNVAVQVPALFVGAFLIEVLLLDPGHRPRGDHSPSNRSDFPVIKAIDRLRRGR